MRRQDYYARCLLLFRYKNEAECAAALKNITKPREEIWITTKVVWSLSDPMAYVEKVLKQFDITYLDCLLIHTPFKFDDQTTMRDSWAKMEAVQASGLVRYIGVSNFRKVDLEQLMQSAKIVPYVNQCENHPYVQHQQEQLQSYMSSKGIRWASYAPLASITRKPGGPVDSVVSELALKYNRTASQILLRWQLEQGHVSLTTSSREQRMVEQLQALTFELSEADVERIEKAGRALYYRAFFVEEIDTP